MMSLTPIEISISQRIGKGYNRFWNYKGRYVVCKGSRASKKSKTTALWHIAKMMEYPLANTLVIRKTERTLRDSCFSDLMWAINRLGVDRYWKVTVSPLEMTYTPTGQKILFRGMDDPFKLSSISVSKGSLCWVWIEEAYEISREADFDTLDESVRGELPEGYFKRLTLTLNPWNEHHWIKARFFDKPSDNVLALTTNYLMNEFLDDADRKVFDDMKARNPRRYQVAGLGNWGVVEGLVYENWKEQVFMLNEVQNAVTCCGLDFGYTQDPSAFVVMFLNQSEKKLWVWDEFYEKGFSNRRIFEKIQELGYAKEKITADSAEPKSIDELHGYGLRIKGAKKGKDSIMNGIQWIQDLEIIIHPRCVNFLTEIQNYQWKEDRFGKKINEPVDDFNHLMDASRYALEDNIKRKGWIT
jgi:phage terminase large subunit